MAALEAAKASAEAEAEAAIAEAQEQQAAVEAKLKAMIAAANAPAPAPGMDLSWARTMDAKSDLPEQGLEGPLVVYHEDGDTMTEDWMQERTPASQLCAICAKSPGNPWCRGKCMKSRPHAAPEQRTVIDVVREAVGGGGSAETETPDSPQSKPIPEQPPASGDTDEPPEDGGKDDDDSTQVPPGFHPPGDIKQSSARKSSVTILGVVTSILVLFSN